MYERERREIVGGRGEREGGRRGVGERVRGIVRGRGGREKKKWG
jgi:hypothetical protein